jgi:hypothetical protein
MGYVNKNIAISCGLILQKKGINVIQPIFKLCLHQDIKIPQSPPKLKGTVSHFCFQFFHESVSPQPQSIPLGPVQIFLKICKDIPKSRCTPGLNNTGGKIAEGINDTGGTFATGINDTGGKVCHQFCECCC